MTLELPLTAQASEYPIWPAGNTQVKSIFAPLTGKKKYVMSYLKWVSTAFPPNSLFYEKVKHKVSDSRETQVIKMQY